MTLKIFYLFAAALGTAIPWLFFGGFFAANGPDPAAFVAGLFVNGAAAGFSADVLISIAVFWLWSLRDARQLGVAAWWLVLPAGLCVGLSLALPLYLYLRHDRAAAAAARSAPHTSG
ncbi:MAG: DUF2834 domain-containing protein [Rhodospirillaceae bacterium]|nr:DUF2834 domain-containing protein [Rhodospirillaceae bacterium]MYB14241.1 DUF2834 domain-containing protein [Rhodospirillaceae bacterium]MYI49291.1 DUF2834 domain-containing protein [Rhodospirillaceae bacterium]